MDKNLVVSKCTIYVGAGMCWVGGVTATQWAALVGIVGTLVGVVCTLFLTYKRNSREQAEHEVRMAELKTDRRNQTRRKADYELTKNQAGKDTK